MAINGHITTLVLQEFRLHAADTADEAARIVATFPDGIEPAVPLLRSIDDQRDVAIVRALHVGEAPDGPQQRASLDPLVASWQPVKRYGPRITESAESPPSSYRLAVTESGINNAHGPVATAPATRTHDQAATRVGLVWVGEPVGTYGGLMVLLGSYGNRVTGAAAPREWALPLSRQLHVRIYETPR
jgi:hypothetical protein